MPGYIFYYTLLTILGETKWWDFPFCLFPACGFGISKEIIGFGDWYIAVYLLVSCLLTWLITTCGRSAWMWICTLTLVVWGIQINLKPTKGMVTGGTYGFLSLGMARGITCMGLGMLAAYLSEYWHPCKGYFVRLTATVFEVLALFMIFDYMFRMTQNNYSYIATEFTVAALLISAAHSWGYLSAILNHLNGVTYVSRYTYSLFLAQAALVSYFRFNHNFGINPHHCAIIIFCAAVPLVLVEYHLVEKWLVPKLKSRFQNAPESD